MPGKEQGHEAAPDYLEMDSDIFAAEVGKIFDGEKTAARDNAGTSAGDTAKEGTTDPLSDDKSDKKPAGAPAAEEVFTLEEKKPAEPAKKADSAAKEGEDFLEIKHRGQIHKVTREKALELAQKGFDYDVKIGPHVNLVNLVQNDPGAAAALQGYLEGKLKGGAAQDAASGSEKGKTGKDWKIRKVSEFDNDEVAWLKNFLEENQENLRPAPREAPAAPAVHPVVGIARQLAGRDPEHYLKVMPRLEEFARQLKHGDYEKVNANFSNLCKFYDWVKGRILSEGADAAAGDPAALAADPAAAAAAGKTVRPQFRAKSGGGVPDRGAGGKDSEDYYWNKSQKEFNQLVAQLKGF